MFGIKNFVIGVAIFILTLAAGIYGISTLYGTAPQYEDYCPSLNTQQACENFGSNWTMYDNNGPKGNGYCDVYSVCQGPYDDAGRAYQRGVFFIALPLGILIIAVGALIFGLESVGGGLMAGGVGIVLYGVGGFWRFADDWLKFVLSLIALIIVIGMAYWFNKKWGKK